MTLATEHAIDMHSLPPGTYYCEIIAFTDAPEQWRTIEDKQGQHFVVVVPVATPHSDATVGSGSVPSTDQPGSAAIRGALREIDKQKKRKRLKPG